MRVEGYLGAIFESLSHPLCSVLKRTDFKKERKMNAVLKRHQGTQRRDAVVYVAEQVKRCCYLELHAGLFTRHSPALASFAGVTVPPVIPPRCPFQLSMICCVGGGVGGGRVLPRRGRCSYRAKSCSHFFLCSACLKDALLGSGKEDALSLRGALRFLLADRRVPRVPGRRRCLADGGAVVYGGDVDGRPGQPRLACEVGRQERVLHDAVEGKALRRHHHNERLDELPRLRRHGRGDLVDATPAHVLLHLLLCAALRAERELARQHHEQHHADAPQVCLVRVVVPFENFGGGVRQRAHNVGRVLGGRDGVHGRRRGGARRRTRRVPGLAALGGAGGRRRDGGRLVQAGQPEVRHLQLAGLRDEAVLGLDVAVCHAGGVAGAQALDEVAEVRDGLVLAQLVLLHDLLAEVAAAHALEHNVVVVLALHDLH
eukprot:Rhum_TRINITY_DN14298_c11_g1::Rhum_TRINITY_DN14298_c11_g1_i1::g.73263::m.73263